MQRCVGTSLMPKAGTLRDASDRSVRLCPSAKFPNLIFATFSNSNIWSPDSKTFVFFVAVIVCQCCRVARLYWGCGVNRKHDRVSAPNHFIQPLTRHESSISIK
ncbi:hypothetical protein GQ43DRAFT_222588 [Delitschia confertaspora ATCC 74209]|uniref:Uncharacterized protein n=1 Tax=Delitschia confertaspora ATCC 74209 TaxID=1513339 RepID=A0A9P4MUT3_9PLEO|nr:hypothetical protein GQ43DRAFT_222588 [Delitschia confertaspora ATCC 74209]